MQCLRIFFPQNKEHYYEWLREKGNKDMQALELFLKFEKKWATRFKKHKDVCWKGQDCWRLLNLLGQNRINLSEEEIFCYLTEEFKPCNHYGQLDKFLKLDGLIPWNDFKNDLDGYLIAAFGEKDDYHFSCLEKNGWRECLRVQWVKLLKRKFSSLDES